MTTNNTDTNSNTISNEVLAAALAEKLNTIESLAGRLSVVESHLRDIDFDDFVTHDTLSDEDFVTERTMETAIREAIDDLDIPDPDDFVSTDDVEEYVSEDDLERAVEEALSERDFVAKDDLDDAVESALSDSQPLSAAVATAVDMARKQDRRDIEALTALVHTLREELETRTTLQNDLEALATLLSENDRQRSRSLWTRVRWTLLGR